MTEAQMIEAMARAIGMRGKCSGCQTEGLPCRACRFDAIVALDAIRKHVRIYAEMRGGTEGALAPTQNNTGLIGQPQKILEDARNEVSAQPKTKIRSKAFMSWRKNKYDRRTDISACED